MISFLKGESEAIVDPEQYEVMAANLALTKRLLTPSCKQLKRILILL
jgi:hypothetical protein